MGIIEHLRFRRRGREIRLLQDTITIKELFKKEIDREINGVVQAGQR